MDTLSTPSSSSALLELYRIENWGSSVEWPVSRAPKAKETEPRGLRSDFLPSGLPICTCEPGQMVRTSKNHSYQATVCPNVHVWMNSRDIWIAPGAQAAAGERLCAPLLTAIGRYSRDSLEYRNREYLSFV